MSAERHSFVVDMQSPECVSALVEWGKKDAMKTDAFTFVEMIPTLSSKVRF